MTVEGIIQQYNSEHSNQLDDQLKIDWLKKLEQRIYIEVVDAHDEEGSVSLGDWMVKGSTLYIPEGAVLSRDFSDFGTDTELIVPEAYDDLYIYYLQQRQAYNNDDTSEYNRATAMFNNTYITFQQYYNRTHKPKSSKSVLFRHEVL